MVDIQSAAADNRREKR